MLAITNIVSFNNHKLVKNYTSIPSIDVGRCKKDWRDYLLKVPKICEITIPLYLK